MENNIKNVLISGGTGMIGTRLTELLRQKNYNVAYLSRSKSSDKDVKVFQWDIDKESIEAGAVMWADYIIHLAGAGIADERWTEKRKKVIRDSRVNSAGLIINQLKDKQHHVKAMITASAIGYYGDTGNSYANEDTPSANDFLGKTAIEWEFASEKAREFGVRVCQLRTGIVLSKEGGALPRLALPVKLFAGAALGNGNQYMSWIHIDDLCQIYLKAIEDKNMEGAYNAVASETVTNKKFNKILADVLNRPLLLPNVPAFALKLFLGQMAQTVLMSSRISNKKILQTGFEFKYDNLKEALEEIYYT